MTANSHVIALLSLIVDPLFLSRHKQVIVFIILVDQKRSQNKKKIPVTF